MTQYAEKLSAFLDGELPENEAREIEDALANDPSLQAELEQLMAADVAAQEGFATMLDEPVPLELAAAIKDTPVQAPANTNSSMRGWLTAAATVVALIFGGVLGYVGGASQNNQIAAAPGWLSDIADYHSVYAGQSRHLVEVSADESDHIKAWLTTTVGTDVNIPDLTQQGLKFEGARLLVAAGKPVAQLMYTDEKMRVVALCLIQSKTPKDGFSEQTINAFDMISWGAGNANFVIVGDEGRKDLNDIALAAAAQV